MNINQLKINLRVLEGNLANNTVQVVLKNQKFSLDELEESIKKYLENIEQIKDEDLLKTIDAKVNNLISNSNERNFEAYSHQFINAANFLINNTPNLMNPFDDIDTSNEIKISEEEFSKRYEKLIETLNFEGEEANLILETPREDRPFKVYKTKTKSLAVYAASSKKPMIIAADRLLEVAFKRKEPTYPSYEIVLISKIMDNSIFDFFTESIQNDLIEAMKNKLLNNENELLKLSSKLTEIENNNQELLTIKQKLGETLEQSKLAKKEYEDAKQAAVDYAQLNASVSYWKTKQEKHRNKFWLFGGGAIVLITLLIGALYWIVDNHYLDKNFIQENNINTSKIIEVNTSKEKNVSNSVAVNIHLQDTNQSTPKSLLKNPSDYLHYFGLYALLIFASSSALWIIRITVKIALSNLHLSEDAHERVVMIQTYLAFVKEGELKDEKDKQLVLSPLFRSSNIGIIKDESSITIADIITAFKK